MNKMWIRRLAFGLLGLLLLLAAVVAWLVASFDANRYKGLAIDWMQRERNRTLAIEGPLELSVIPRLQIKASGVRLSEKGRPDEFAALDEAALAVRLWPLLSNRLVVDRIGAKGVRLVYTRSAKGERNLDDLMAPDSQGAGGGPALQFDIGRVQLDDVRLSVRDELTPVRGEVTLESLTAGRLARDVESPISLKAQLALTQPLVKGVLSGDTRLKLDQATGSATLTGMKLNFKGDAATAKAIEATVQGLLAYDGTAGSLRAEGLNLDLDATLGAVKLAGSRLGVERFAYQPAGKTLQLARLQMKLTGQQGKDPFTLALDWPQLEVSGDKLKGSALSGSLLLAGSTALEGRFQSGPPAGNFDQVRLPAVSLGLKGRSGPREIDGTLKSELLLQVAKSALAFERLDLQAQVKEPSLQPLALVLRGSASASAKNAAWKLTGGLGANAFASDGTAQFGTGAPNVTASARFDSLDLNTLLAPEKSAGAAPAPARAASGPPAADTPVDLAGLRAVNGRFSLQAGKLALRQVRIADAKVDATLDRGMLRLTRVNGQTWGGSIDAGGYADAASNRVGLKLAGAGVNVNALLRDLAGFDRLEGTGRVSADLESVGRSVNEMRSRLKGAAALQLRDGAIKGINLAKSLRQAKAALSLKRDEVQRANQAEKTDFSELSASFQVNEGVARSKDLDMKSPFLRLGGEGAIDLGRGRIDYTARATVASTTKGQDGAELAALRGLTIPVRLTGPLDAVDWRIEWSAVAAGALTNKLEDRLRESIDKRLGARPPADAASSPAPARPEDKLKERLRGLFK